MVKKETHVKNNSKKRESRKLTNQIGFAVQVHAQNL